MFGGRERRSLQHSAGGVRVLLKAERGEPIRGGGGSRGVCRVGGGAKDALSFAEMGPCFGGLRMGGEDVRRPHNDCHVNIHIGLFGSPVPVSTFLFMTVIPRLSLGFGVGHGASLARTLLLGVAQS